MQQNLTVVVANIDSRNTFWDINLGLRQPYFFKGSNTYIGGMNCTARLFPAGTLKEQETDENALVTLKSGIVGAFQTENQFNEQTEQNLAKVQIPAILFPYLRASMSSVTSSAGLNSLQMPLINVQKWAEDNKDKLAIQIVEAPPIPTPAT